MVHKENCFCDKVKKINLKTKVSLVLFRKEVFLPSNTAHLTLKSLTNSEEFQRGFKDQLLQSSFIDSEHYQPLYLYPSEESQELTPKLLAKFDRPINLIVPDGTWRQAKKVHRREPLLANVPQVKITPNIKSTYPLRRQKFEFGLCTHEAISFALKIIEGENAYKALMDNFNIFIQAHLKNRVIYDKKDE